MRLTVEFIRLIILISGISFLQLNQVTAQQGYVFFPWSPPDGQMTWNGSVFTYTGYFDDYCGYYFNGVSGVQSTDGLFPTFPNGNIYPNTGEYASIPAGYYNLTLNPQSGAYSFENSSACFSAESAPSFLIYNEYIEGFCQPVEMFASLIVDGQDWGLPFYDIGLDYQWLLNGVPIAGANSFDLYYYPSFSDSDVLTFAATCPINNDTIFSNSIVYSDSNQDLAIYNFSNPLFCEPLELYGDLVSEDNWGQSISSNIQYEWLLNGSTIPGADNLYFSFYPSSLEVSEITLIASCPVNNDTLITTSILYPDSSQYLEITNLSDQSFCEPLELNGELISENNGGISASNIQYQWLRNGAEISGAIEPYLPSASPASMQPTVFTLMATCDYNSDTLISNEVTIPVCYYDFSSSLNYLLVQNVTTTGNVPGQSIQVQFDLNWGNTWKDNVNWDAVWIFMKYKDAQGIWQHAKVSPSGFDHGQGTPNMIEPSADQMGAFVRLSEEGTGNFDVEGMQLRWNYGSDGLSSVAGIEVRVYAIEMVYTPQGDYKMSQGALAPGNKIPVVNTRLSPLLSADGDSSLRIKGDSGIDLDANGTVENTIYPTGYYPFYIFKYEMSEQQYADFLNCLTSAQRATLGVAGSTITQTAGQYYASSPNQVCSGANADRVLAYADWAGLRPMSYLEYQKALNGPKASNPNGQMYGIKNLGGSLSEPYVRISSTQYNRTNHGNGILSTNGQSNVTGWSASEMGTISGSGDGFRLCRTAE